MASGSYCLCIQVSEDIAVNIGALGIVSFSKGRYIYVGSALNGLALRIKRHFATNEGKGKAIHWHIDYLLLTIGVKLEGVYIKESDKHEECTIAIKIADKGYPIRGFGCSDCRCISHLFWVESFNILNEIGLKRVEINSFTSLITPL
jgi:Uri superfamily endonuclease